MHTHIYLYIVYTKNTYLTKMYQKKYINICTERIIKIKLTV